MNLMPGYFLSNKFMHKKIRHKKSIIYFFYAGK